MRTIYIDCGMGAAGDMLTAALLELLPDPDGFIREFNELGIPGVVAVKERSVKCGITGTHFSVKVHGVEEDEHIHDHHHGHDHHHSHGSMDEIRRVVHTLPIPGAVKLDIMAVYDEIAQAESRVHGVPVNQIHFHEVGSMDAVADITAVCLLMHKLDADQIIVSPVHVGSGSVKCAHGILPVPAPATALILKDVPIYGGQIKGELCTPTGAALLKHFAGAFGDMPQMSVEKIGYGMGRKDFEKANCVRVMLGKTFEKSADVVELSCNLDDMTGEELGFAMEVLMENGALDVFTTAIGMKKSRPGQMLTVLCKEQDRERMVHLMLKHTTTIGVREQLCRRYTLGRKMASVQTEFGTVRKKASAGFGVTKEKYEFEDLAKIARDKGISLREVKALLEQ